MSHRPGPARRQQLAGTDVGRCRLRLGPDGGGGGRRLARVGPARDAVLRFAHHAHERRARRAAGRRGRRVCPSVNRVSRRTDRGSRTSPTPVVGGTYGSRRRTARARSPWSKRRTTTPRRPGHRASARLRGRPMVLRSRSIGTRTVSPGSSWSTRRKAPATARPARSQRDGTTRSTGADTASWPSARARGRRPRS